MIVLKNESQIDKIRKACRLVAKMLSYVETIAKPGITTKELDLLAERLALSWGAKPAFKGYKNFPYSICASVNDELIHGMPSDRPLQEGDILSVDYGILLEGYHGDSSITVPIGTVSEEAEKLIKTGQECLYHGIKAFCRGARLNDISYAIQSHAESNGYSVARNFCGHGIGKALHEEPQVFNFTNPAVGSLMVTDGTVLAIEPMVMGGDYETYTKPNGWTVMSADGKLSSHWEHTVALTEKGTEILTLREGEIYE